MAVLPSAMEETPARRSSVCRNGSKTRKTLPLWKRIRDGGPSTALLGMIAPVSAYRNGSKTRETLPLWRRNGIAMSSRKRTAWVRGGT